jgi:hypothetical protein
MLLRSPEPSGFAPHFLPGPARSRILLELRPAIVSALAMPTSLLGPEHALRFTLAM